jgi:hypothetical protein
LKRAVAFPDEIAPGVGDLPLFLFLPRRGVELRVESNARTRRLSRRRLRPELIEIASERDEVEHPDRDRPEPSVARRVLQVARWVRRTDDDELARSVGRESIV